MLTKMGVSKEELGDLLVKYSDFKKTLKPNQQALLEASSPTLEDAAASFGPAVSPSDLQSLFKEAAPAAMTNSTNVGSMVRK